MSNYKEDIYKIASEKLESVQETDSRLNAILKKRAKAIKRNDGKLVAELDAEYESRRIQITEDIINKEIVNQYRERTLSKYMSGEKAAKFNMLCDAVDLITDVLDSLYVDMASLAHESTDFIRIYFPIQLRDAQTYIRKEKKDVEESLQNDIRDMYRDTTDKLLEIVLEHAKEYHSKAYPSREHI